jgi:hypothetical protein
MSYFRLARSSAVSRCPIFKDQMTFLVSNLYKITVKYMESINIYLIDTDLKLEQTNT